MTGGNTRDHWEQAKELRQKGEFVEAGDYYTVAAYGYLGEDLPGRFGVRISHGASGLQRAALCYRLASRRGRCQNRAKQGILIAEDMLDRVFVGDPPDNHYDRARRGAWHEYIGDFQLMADLADPTDAYEQAIAVYEDAGDPGTGYAEQEHGFLIWLYQSVGSAVGCDIDPIDTGLNDLTFSDWVAMKRENLPSFLTDLDDQATWPTMSGE